jgi:hypothetical protein
VRVERDSGMCVARDFYEQGSVDPTSVASSAASCPKKLLVDIPVVSDQGLGLALPILSSDSHSPRQLEVRGVPSGTTSEDFFAPACGEATKQMLGAEDV